MPPLAPRYNLLKIHNQSKRLKLKRVRSLPLHDTRFPLTCAAALVVPPKVVAQALGLALAIGLAVGVGVQVFGPAVLVQLAGEKSKEVSEQA